MKNLKIVLLGILLLPFISLTKVDIELIKKSFFEDSITLKIPKKFEIMSEDLVKTKYPLHQRPSIVYSNDTGRINVALNLTKGKANEELVQTYLETFKSTFSKMKDRIQLKDSGIQVHNGRKVGFLKLVSPAVDGKIYNIMFFTHVNDKLLLCSFNCPEEFMETWKDTGDAILNSLEVQ